MCLLLGIGDGEHDREVGVGAVGDEVLRPVEHEVIAVARCARADRLRIGTGVGLRQSETHRLLCLHERHEVLLLELGRRLEQEPRRRLRVRRAEDRSREAQAGLRACFDEQRVPERRQAPAADLFG